MSPLPDTAVSMLYPVLAILFGAVAVVVAVLVAAVKGFRWANEQWGQRFAAELASVAFRATIRDESVAALRSQAGREELRMAAAEALQGLAGPLMSAQSEHARQLRDLKVDLAEAKKAHGERLGALDVWAGKADVLLRDVAEHGRKLSALERGWVTMTNILKRAKLTDREEVGQ